MTFLDFPSWISDSVTERTAQSVPRSLPHDFLADVIPDITWTARRSVLLAEMSDFLRTLDSPEQIVLGLLYCDALTLEEIGQVMSVDEQTIFEVAAQAALKLRARLAASQHGPHPVS